MAFINPAEIVDRLDIMPGMRVADFGCGSGHFTVEMAKRAGSGGLVYAFDVQKEPLEALKSKLALDNITNVDGVRADLETEKSTGLSPESLDFVLISNMLFQSEKKDMVAKEALRVLKTGGRLALVEWKPEAAVMGPVKQMRISKEEARNIFEKAGFSFEREFEAGDDHYVLILKK